MSLEPTLRQIISEIISKYSLKKEKKNIALARKLTFIL